MVVRMSVVVVVVQSDPVLAVLGGGGRYNEVVEDGVGISVVVVNCKERYPVKSHLLLPLPLIDLTKSKTCKRPSRF